MVDTWLEFPVVHGKSLSAEWQRNTFSSERMDKWSPAKVSTTFTVVSALTENSARPTMLRIRSTTVKSFCNFPKRRASAACGKFGDGCLTRNAVTDADELKVPLQSLGVCACPILRWTLVAPAITGKTPEHLSNAISK
jgi:hypothetical protein